MRSWTCVAFARQRSSGIPWVRAWRNGSRSTTLNARLVLIGAFATFQGPEFRAFVIASIRPLVDPIGAAYAREWQLSTLATPMDPVHLDTVVAETLKVPAFVWHAAFEGFLATADFSSQLANVSAPVLLVWGDHDTYANRAGQHRLLKVIPSVRLITYKGHGHAVHWEDPGRVAADLIAFIKNWRYLDGSVPLGAK